MNAPMIR